MSTLIHSGNSFPSGVKPSYFTTSLLVSFITLNDKFKVFLGSPEDWLVLFSATKSTNFKPSDKPVLVSIFKASIVFVLASKIEFKGIFLPLINTVSDFLISFLINLSAFLSLNSLTALPFCNLIIIVAVSVAVPSDIV